MSNQALGNLTRLSRVPTSTDTPHQSSGAAMSLARNPRSLTQAAPLTALFLLSSLLGGISPATAQEPVRRVAQPERVYVPIEDFDRIFDSEKGGVFLPFADLKRLLERAQGNAAKRPVEVPVEPPTDYVLVGARFSGLAGDRVARFTATFEIEVLRENAWVVVPIGLGTASLESVKASGGKAIVGPLAQLVRQAPGARGAAAAAKAKGYGILVRGPGRVQTTATFAVPIRTKPGESSFDIELPRAALTQFVTTLPQSGIKVDVKGALATEASDIKGKDQTRVRAYFDSASKARVVWNPKAKAVDGETQKPVLFAQTKTSVRLDEGVLQVVTRIGYEIRRAPCDTFRVRFPKGYTLLGVEGENMRETPFPKAVGDEQEIVVHLHDKAESKYSLVIRLERQVGEATSGKLAFPRIATAGTEREWGILAARASQYVSMEPQDERGVTQIDHAKLSAVQASDLGWQPAAKSRKGRRKGAKRPKRARPPLVFRYLLQPYGLNLAARPIEPEVKGKVYTLATLRDDQIALKTAIYYEVRKRGIFSVRLLIPKGIDLEPFNDQVIKKDTRLPGPTADTEILQLDFVNQQEDAFWLPLSGTVERSAKQPETGTVGLVLPRIGLLDVLEEKGFLGVGAQTHLKLTYDEEKSSRDRLLELSLGELQGNGFRHTPGKGEELIFGLKYSYPKDLLARFEVRKKESKLTAKVESLVDAQEDLVKVKTAIRLNVEHAGIEVLKLQVPKELKTDKDLKFERDGLIKEPRIEIKGEYAIWTIPLQGKRLGEFVLRCEYDIKLENFQPSQQRKITLHEIKVLDCFSETGDIALKKHENLVIREAAMTSLEKRDKRDLPSELKAQGPIQAYRYVSHPHQLELVLTKYDFQAPLGILVKHLHLDEVLDEDGLLKVEAWLLIQNNAEQFLTLLLPPEAKMRGLLVDGDSEEWSEGDAVEARPSIQVHLGEVTKGRKQEPFLVRIRYDLPARELGRTGRRELFTLALPLKGDKTVPVARLTRSLYLPEGYAYLDFDTDATKHFDETSLWESLKQALGVRTGRDRFQRRKAGSFASAQVRGLKQGPVRGTGAGGIYPLLELPQGLKPYLFEKLANPSRLSVRYSTWPLFFLLDVLAFLGVVLLGIALDTKKVVAPLVYVGGAAAISLLGAVFLGRALEPYFASGLVGSLGLGGFFLTRGLWRELTVLRHERRLEELEKEAGLARARADAAQREGALRGVVVATPKPAAPEASADAKAKGGDEAEAAAAADRIVLEGTEATREAPAEETTSQEAPAEEAPAEEAPTEEAPAEETTAQEPKASAEDTPDSGQEPKDGGEA